VSYKNSTAGPDAVHMPPVQHDMEKADREGRPTFKSLLM
jgi:hypothetical protein